MLVMRITASKLAGVGTSGNNAVLCDALLLAKLVLWTLPLQLE